MNREGLVWHEGVEFGLPRVDPNLVVRTSGSVSFDEQLDLTIQFPVPLYLFADGPLARAISDNSLTVRAEGTLREPQLKIADADLLGSVLSRLSQEERPLQGILQGIRDSLMAGRQDDEARGDDTEDQPTAPLRFLERLRRRRQGP
jgi:hypothetical protein